MKNEIDLTKKKFSNDRAKFRKELINIFLDEKSGTGKGNNTSRYKYIVRQLKDGREIYLNRPANFNNGFDFTINVSETNFNKYLNKKASTRPTHDNILTDLRNKKEETPTIYKLLMEQIELVFSCAKPTELDFNFQNGHPTELIIECIKWLFEEQDVTYWNYSGRLMFYKAIKNI
jgi:hypothetical protein